MSKIIYINFKILKIKKKNLTLNKITFRLFEYNLENGKKYCRKVEKKLIVFLFMVKKK